MGHQEINAIIDKILFRIEKLIPDYLKNPEDKPVSNGNLAICVIDESGRVYGRMYGDNKPRMRQSYRVAWTKASQVWLTGEKTGEYERRLFNGEIPENANGIENPDLIGWVGGQPITLHDGTKLSVGFSGFRGTTDIDIVARAQYERTGTWAAESRPDGIDLRPRQLLPGQFEVPGQRQRIRPADLHVLGRPHGAAGLSCFHPRQFHRSGEAVQHSFSREAQRAAVLRSQKR